MWLLITFWRENISSQKHDKYFMELNQPTACGFNISNETVMTFFALCTLKLFFQFFSFFYCINHFTILLLFFIIFNHHRALFVDAKFFLSFRMKHFLFSMSPFSIWIWIIHCRVWNRGILSVIRILTAVRLLPVICILSIIWVLIDVLVVSSSLSLLIRHWAAIPFFFHICLFNNRCDKRNSRHRIFL